MMTVLKNRSIFALICLLNTMLFGAIASAEDANPDGEMPNIEWLQGPIVGDLGNAELTVPAGHIYTNVKGTQTLLESMENPLTQKERGTVIGQNPDGSEWIAIFEFDQSGYVKDEDKDDIDADEILESIREGTQAGNVERQKRGWPDLNILGWAEEPHYDERTKHLVWAIRSESEGQIGINYNVKLLGRKGVMSAILLVSEAKLAESTPPFLKLLEDFTFKDGHLYSQYQQGDKIAEYGLVGLIAGGAAAAALNAGLLKKFGKFILFGFLAIGGFLKKLFFGRQSETA